MELFICTFDMSCEHNADFLLWLVFHIIIYHLQETSRIKNYMNRLWDWDIYSLLFFLK